MTTTARELSARDVVEQFYKGYLGAGGAPANRHLELPYSGAMTRLLQENARLCRRSTDDICGWGADGDVYLDTQEEDPDLTYERARVSATAPQPDVVVVTFNVYPSQKDAGLFYQRTLTYRMRREHGHWVVDDIVYPSGASARQIIAAENRAEAAQTK